jgi:hypothetical protein
LGWIYCPPAFRKMGGSNFLYIPEHSNHH